MSKITANKVDLSLLPQNEQEIAELIGLLPTMRLVSSCGGTRVWFPEIPTWQHRLASVIGMPALKKLCSHYYNQYVYINRCTEALQAVRDQEINRRLDSGEKASDLALEFGMTERNVYLIKASFVADSDTPQHSLL